MSNRMGWAAGLLLALGLLPTLAGAQSGTERPDRSVGYPARPVKLVLGFAPGGAADFVSRVFQEPLAKELGQPIIVENRPGAGSSIAAEYVAKSAPDGYTMLIASPSSILVNPLITPKASFDSKRDLIPVSKVSSSPLLIAVHQSVGVTSLRELIAYAKKSPGKLNFASSGNGAAPHLAAVLFMRLAGVDMVHVPYKGGGPAVASLLAGDTQLSFATPPSVLPHVQSGRLRALAVTSRQRTPLVPGVPGMVEAGLPDYEISFWYGFFVPAGTPREVVKKLFDATSAVVALPAVNKLLEKEGTETSGSKSPEDFAAFIAEDAKLWARLVKESGAKAD
jgi:tripartite-type tricarboxylate transporter receptor subunit TctC